MTTSLRIVIMALVITAISSAPLLSSEQFFQQARDAYSAGDYQGAETIWRQRAEAGELASMFALGSLLAEGPGDYPVNYIESSEWYLKAAQLGHVGAQYYLGNAYQKGLGVMQDDEQTAYWWQKAAEQGMPKAAYQLGVQYMYGRGLPQDYEQAMKMFQIAAARGHPAARKLLSGWGLKIPKTEVIEEENDSRPIVTTDSNVQITAIAAVTEIPDQSGTGLTRKAISEPEIIGSTLSPIAGSESRILEIPPEYFTLQVAAMSKPGLVDDYIRQHQLSGDLYRYQFLRGSSTLYGLSIGTFMTREEAIAFRNQLEQSKQNESDWQTPWLRRFIDIQLLIRLLQTPEQ